MVLMSSSTAVRLPLVPVAVRFWVKPIGTGLAGVPAFLDANVIFAV